MERVIQQPTTRGGTLQSTNNTYLPPLLSSAPSIHTMPATIKAGKATHNHHLAKAAETNNDER